MVSIPSHEMPNDDFGLKPPHPDAEEKCELAAILYLSAMQRGDKDVAEKKEEFVTWFQEMLYAGGVMATSPDRYGMMMQKYLELVAAKKGIRLGEGQSLT